MKGFFIFRFLGVGCFAISVIINTKTVTDYQSIINKNEVWKDFVLLCYFKLRIWLVIDSSVLKEQKLKKQFEMTSIQKAH